MEPSQLPYFSSGLSPPSDLDDLINGSRVISQDSTSWVDTLVPESGFDYTGPVLIHPDEITDHTWTSHIGDYDQCMQSQLSLTMVNADVDEDYEIRLVHALLKCADAIQRGELLLAGGLIHEMSHELMTRVNTSCGIGKVAGYFVDALTRRVYHTCQQGLGRAGPGLEYEVLYHHFYEACPYLKFAHFTANQAILEAFNGYDHVHVIDFSLMHGLQWPALIQALALRSGGPPTLRITGIVLPSEGGSQPLRDIGLSLAQLARSVNLRFTFRAVVVARLDEIKPFILETNPREAVAINCILQLHQLLGSGIDSILKWIHSLNPKIVTLVEQEANHNQPEFLTRFTEALYYYSTIFDSFESCRQVGSDKYLAELYIQREISNIVCCEGADRVERHEPLTHWWARMVQAGFNPRELGPNAYRQASMLLTMCSSEGYSVQECRGCLMLSWHSRPLIAASAWEVGPTNMDGHHGMNVILHNTSSSSSSLSS